MTGFIRRVLGQWTARPKSVRRREDADIIVEMMPEPHIRKYVVVSHERKLTTTPNFMSLGFDLSHCMVGYVPMDAATERLYDNIRAVDYRIDSVTIEAFSVCVGFCFDSKFAGWLRKEQEVRLLQLIADHLEWTEPPRPFYRKVTMREETIGVYMLIAPAVARGDIAPPPWWKE